MKHKKQKTVKKHKEPKKHSKRITNTILLICLAISAGLLWKMFNAQLEHRNQHYAEDTPKQYKQSIKELEEIVRKAPDNYSAWKLLGIEYRREKNQATAQRAWTRALEIAHSEDEPAWLKETLAHIDKHHH